MIDEVSVAIPMAVSDQSDTDESHCHGVPVGLSSKVIQCVCILCENLLEWDGTERV